MHMAAWRTWDQRQVKRMMCSSSTRQLQAFCGHETITHLNLAGKADSRATTTSMRVDSTVRTASAIAKRRFLTLLLPTPPEASEATRSDSLTQVSCWAW